ncbi:type II toxin-antitoxin system HigB family toxin [Roseateles sp.]|uniref:type II toxin-antitoxin system HigB family toxin n=1 Tax=Roseateles sp. TaxID=1971397 RepID=UPI002F3E7089
MHILSKSRLREFWEVHPPAKGPMEAWHAVVERAAFTCFADVPNTYNSADQVGDAIVFNVNSYRIVASVRYLARRVFISHVFTHAECEKWSKAQRKK